MDYKVGDRVAKDLKNGHTSFGTIYYVKPDRVGVAWDERQPERGDPIVFPAQRGEIRPR